CECQEVYEDFIWCNVHHTQHVGFTNRSGIFRCSLPSSGLSQYSSEHQSGSYHEYGPVYDILPDDCLQTAEIRFERQQQPADNNTDGDIQSDCHIQYRSDRYKERTAHCTIGKSTADHSRNTGGFAVAQCRIVSDGDHLMFLSKTSDPFKQK